MTTQVSQSSADQAANRHFAHELELVRGNMLQPVLALDSPLRELILSQAESSGPPYRAALVLCAGFDNTQGSSEGRVNLAAALELLNVALGIHEQLLDSPYSSGSSDPVSEQRTYIGGNILAGDFCFSCSAQMAARTESPAVVATFATALQTVSENRLRTLLPEKDSTPEDRSPSTDQIMLRSGAAAAMELSDLDNQTSAVVENTVNELVLAGSTFPPPDDVWQERLAMLPGSHWRRWMAYRHWLLELSNS